MSTDDLRLRPIGVARTPYRTPAEAPRQGFLVDDEASVEVFEPYAPALAGVEHRERLTVVYWADGADREFLANERGEGAFSKRTPNRPNPLNVCPCELVALEGRTLRVRGLDAVDGSTVVDVKPTLRTGR